MKYYNKYYNWLFFDDFIKYFKTCYFNDSSIFFIEKIKDHKEYEYKLFLTYMKNFVITDYEDEDKDKFSTLYESGLKKCREILFYSK